MYSSVQATSRYFSAFFLPDWGFFGPTLIGVSSQLTACAEMIRDRIRRAAGAIATAARLKVPCTNPTEGTAPLSDSSIPAHRCTGTACTTIRNTHQLSRFGPYPVLPVVAPSGGRAVCFFPATAPDLMPVVLDGRGRHQRDLRLLVAISHTKIIRA